jgi:hypothetical protein
MYSHLYLTYGEQIPETSRIPLWIRQQGDSEDFDKHISQIRHSTLGILLSILLPLIPTL